MTDQETRENQFFFTSLLLNENQCPVNLIILRRKNKAFTSRRGRFIFVIFGKLYYKAYKVTP